MSRVWERIETREYTVAEIMAAEAEERLAYADELAGEEEEGEYLRSPGRPVETIDVDDIPF